ncbi:MAG: hypothetical protein QNJ97_23745 [Myxococcota bacterium]|nr:hypothetical protein [Myxococcota bacterium]
MKKKVRITRIDEQDALRRKDTLSMTPEQRVAMLVEILDRMGPNTPIERVVTVRELG